jgi:hypothetical protein
MAVDDTGLVKLNLRLREPTRDRLTQAARESGRSLNAEIVARIEQSLRADDAHGRDDQAWLLSQLAALMNEVSAEFNNAWWKSYTSWRLVFRCSFFLIKQHRPALRQPLDELLSTRGRKEVARWDREFAQMERALFEDEQRRVELRIAQEALKDDYAVQQLRELGEEPAERAPPPKLAPSDMEIWARRRAEDEQALIVFRQVLPILRAARHRRRNRARA